MADAAHVSTPTKATKKRAGAGKPKAAASHPTYQSMVQRAISALKEHKGSSRQAILKYIMANFKVGTDARAVNARLRLALQRGVKAGALKNSKGNGASGSFRLGEKKAKVAKAKKPRAKKAGAAKKKVATKKTAGGATKPKKASKPKTKTTKPKSPKKAKSPKAKKPKATKRPAAKKVKKSPKKAKKTAPAAAQ